jgi:hypothetical protein
VALRLFIKYLKAISIKVIKKQINIVCPLFFAKEELEVKKLYNIIHILKKQKEVFMKNIIKSSFGFFAAQIPIILVGRPAFPLFVCCAFRPQNKKKTQKRLFSRKMLYR